MDSQQIVNVDSTSTEQAIPDSSDSTNQSITDSSNASFDNNYSLLRFTSPEEAYSFYCDHAHQRGFSVRKGRETFRNSKNEKVDIPYYLYYVCNKEGYKRDSFHDPSWGKEIESSLVPKKTVRRKVKEERTGCKSFAKFQFVESDGIWKMVKWFDEHNHPLHPPHLSRFIRSNRNIDGFQAQLIDDNANAGLSVKSSYQLISQAAGGRSKVGYLISDLKNHLRSKRSIDMAPGELSILLDFLSSESQSKPSFFYDIQLDEDDLITNIFWSDGMMRYDYACFGDFVSLDTTFRTNNTYRPLAAFIGFTHHRQSCIFAAALLFDQTADTFEWLLNTFLKCMSGKKPVTLFTDQDAAMKNAISIVLPETFHGLCTWHISQNATKKLGSLATNKFFKHFQYLFKQVDDESDFDYNWDLMIKDCFHGVEHSWLTYIYPFRRQWSSAWVKNHFTAGLRSTQLSESFNSFLRTYHCIDHSLTEFFKHFNIMLDNMREKHHKSEHEAIQFLPDIRFHHSAIVKQAAKQYTPPLFTLFQEQYAFLPEYYVDMNIDTSSLTRKVYYVFKLDTSDLTIRLDQCVVQIDLETVEWICSCRMFENWGLLCRHILKAIDILGSCGHFPDLRCIPDKYVLKRWTRTARSGFETWSVPEQVGSTCSKFNLRYQQYCSTMMRNFSRVCMNDDVYFDFMKDINQAFSKAEERMMLTQADASTQQNSEQGGIFSSTSQPHPHLKAAKGIKKKSDPNKSRKRLKAANELSMERSKALRQKTRTEEEVRRTSTSPLIMFDIVDKNM